MADLGRGIIAGLVATLVMTILMVFRLAAGIMPWFNPIEVMSLAAQTAMNVVAVDVLGWFIHFVVGVLLWGGLFGLLAGFLPGGGYLARGLIFGVLAWLLVMVVLFPLAGSGLFGMGFGALIPFGTLLSHLIYGAVLGASFGWLKRL
ncbi:DUF6789 family protein [Aquisalimonas asiatica]|uniref:Uncharacterized protein n=1 Tax=Aquisalimonas asiatica TaxID=406100 RepID=A0A1H8THF5_9GAMM|nr:DUF6789 family protein [Aquisalimonas asiatica]SEO90352.1 hypothetical protein SAMN04488052_104190 [Aquisalimonas asiatica]